MKDYLALLERRMAEIHDLIHSGGSGAAAVSAEWRSGLKAAFRDAFARIADGTYGDCRHCSRPIGRAKLELSPWTAACERCEPRPRSANYSAEAVGSVR